MAGHPLRPATHRRLGRPLPYQQANGTRAPPRATTCMQRSSLMRQSEDRRMLCGISPAFARLFPTQRQITHALLTRAPLYSGSCPPFRVRLACVRHAASVRSEPGSNSPVENRRILLSSADYLYCLEWSQGRHALFSFQRTGLGKGGTLGSTVVGCQELSEKS